MQFCFDTVPHHGEGFVDFAVKLKLLGRIRTGELDTKDIELPGVCAPVTAIGALNLLCAGDTGSQKMGMILCATRRQAALINTLQLEKLDSHKHIFRAEKTGKFLERDYPTEEILSLQVGERVMAVANRKLGSQYVYANGDLGTVVQINVDHDGIGHVIVAFDNGNTAEVERCEWNTYKFEIERDHNSGREIIKRKVDGAFRQIPLRAGYATTIHKAQGLTLDEVTVDIGNGCFAPGQLYTALSRCRSIKTLHLARPIHREDAQVSPDVMNFYRQLG